MPRPGTPRRRDVTLRSAGIMALVLGSVAVPVAALRQDRLPNELGRIPILEYHKVDRPEARWTRTPENFRADLERFWKNGYRLVALTDLLAGRIAAPAGTTPMVLTFDDSSPGQFRFLEQRGDYVIDPECAVGILEQFAREHPEFGHAATFYVLTGASPPNKLFNQPALAARKLKYLAEHGYEIGNHTLWHADLVKYEEPTVRQQLAAAQREVDRAVPGYRLHTLALPMGDYPREVAWAISGSVNGVTYQNDAILKVAGGAALSPFDRLFDPYHLPRIQATELELRAWLTDFDRHPERRYISDGDATKITVPPGARDRVKPSYSARVTERE
jgi:peptidoglycan/xylan/chitin deacetylase (PgdA/CDA1 family)